MKAAAPTIARRAWQRRRRSANPSAILEALRTRQLVDVERCRLAWEGAGDPVAVLTAVTHADLPEWLADALLILLADGAHTAALQRTLWRRRKGDLRDLARAAGVTIERFGLGKKWDQAFNDADGWGGRRHYGVSPAAVKRSFQRVRQGIRNPGRYHDAAPGLDARLNQAVARVCLALEAWGK